MAPPQGRGGGSGEEELEESKRERERETERESQEREREREPTGNATGKAPQVNPLRTLGQKKTEILKCGIGYMYMGGGDEGTRTRGEERQRLLRRIAWLQR